jgi:outer membrane protein assembly factor BamB
MRALSAAVMGYGFRRSKVLLLAWAAGVRAASLLLFHIIERHRRRRRGLADPSGRHPLGSPRARMVSQFPCAVVVVLVALPWLGARAEAQLGDTPWPMRGHDIRRTGRSEVNGPHTAHLKWKLYLGGPWGVPGAPVLGADGTIYIGGSDRYLHAISPDGTEKWRFRNGDAIPSEPAIGIDGTVYSAGYDGHLYALNPDGTLKWDLPGVRSVSGGAAIGDDGTIYFGSMNNRLYAVSPAGQVKWTYQVGEDIEEGPAIGLDGTLYFGSWDKSFYAVWPDGTLRWSMYLGSAACGHPAVGDDGTVYFGDRREFLYAVTPDGQPKWKLSVPGGAGMSVSLGYDGTIYAGALRLFAFSPDGEELWRFRPEFNAGISDASGATAPDGMIYFGSFDYCIYALDRNGEKVWSYRAGDWITGAPAIGVDGTVYTSSRDGYVYAFGVIPEEGAWAALLFPALTIVLRTGRRR